MKRTGPGIPPGRGDPPRQPRSRNACLRTFAGLLLAGLAAGPARAGHLTNAAQVLSLSGEQAAERLRVELRGIVTAAEPTWGGRFFIQDETSGVFVENLATIHPEPGDLVELMGVTHPGAYAPIITSPVWKRVGEAPLPEARRVPIEQIMSGIEDGQRVEVAGIIRNIQPGQPNMDVDLASGGYRLHVFPKMPTNADPATMIGARVRVRGTAAASFNAQLRHMISVAMFVPQPSDFVIEATEAANPFDEPILPLRSVAQYRRDLSPGKRIHVKGAVTLQRPGQDLFLEDETGGLHIRSIQPQSFQVGEVIEAVGFQDFDHFLPVLEDAVFRKTAERRPPLQAKQATIREIQDGLHHADRITLPAKVLDRSFSRTRWRADGREWTRTVLLLQQDDQVFTAEAESPQNDTALARIPLGSTIELTGICFTENGADKKLKTFQILLPDAGSFRLLQRPSWLTPRRLLIGLAALLAVLMAAVSWIFMITKRNAILHGLIQEKEKAQLELQQAHDLLEERVKERTAQLKFQITARKESELQFKAVLSERTRLAQELHDTLEQTLTGIALQLDTTSKLFQAKPENASRHLELARELVGQSQVEVRRSVWDLRSRALEQFDLPGALITSCQQLTDRTQIRFQVNPTGRVRPLPETVEDNLLRIAQEAMTNVIKHSQASEVKIDLDYGAKTVLLRVKDNGRGFDPGKSAGPNEGHFGLLGISERARRLNAELVLDSQPGAGTRIELRVPLPPEPRLEAPTEPQIAP
jgi:signal transduction histidine kinase